LSYSAVGLELTVGYSAVGLDLTVVTVKGYSGLPVVNTSSVPPAHPSSEPQVD